MAEKRSHATRKPVHLVAKDGFRTGKERIWHAIRALAARGKPFTRCDVAFEAKCSEGSARNYMEHLQLAGFLKAAGKQPKRNGWYRNTPYLLARDNGIEAPKLKPDGTPAEQGMVREQLWRALRILGHFDVIQLVGTASTDKKPVKRSAAANYLGVLQRAGYVVTARGYSGSGRARGRTVYRFLQAMNTGPKPPMLQRSGAVFDPNLNKVVWQP